jgi:hypothetical protein
MRVARVANKEKKLATEITEGVENGKKIQTQLVSAGYILRTWGAAVLRPYTFCREDRVEVIG